MRREEDCVRRVSVAALQTERGTGGPGGPQYRRRRIIPFVPLRAEEKSRLFHGAEKPGNDRLQSARVRISRTTMADLHQALIMSGIKKRS